MIILFFPHKSREQQQMTSFFMIQTHEIGCTVSLFQTRNKKELVNTTTPKGQLSIRRKTTNTN